MPLFLSKLADDFHRIQRNYLLFSSLLNGKMPPITDNSCAARDVPLRPNPQYAPEESTNVSLISECMWALGVWSMEGILLECSARRGDAWRNCLSHNLPEGYQRKFCEIMRARSFRPLAHGEKRKLRGKQLLKSSIFILWLAQTLQSGPLSVYEKGSSEEILRIHCSSRTEQTGPINWKSA